MKSLIILSALLAYSAAASAYQRASNSNQQVNLQQDFDSLGDNAAVIQRAKALDPKNKTRVVESRAVDLYNRFEIGVNGGLIGGGDSYYSTQALGANLDFHFNPHWSVGARYSHYFNSLTSEGQNTYNAAQANFNNGNVYHVPSLDYPIDSTLGVVTFYPLYGKVNLFDQGVSHFDIYVLGGGGVSTLASGTSPTYTAGGGFAFWWTNWFSTRLEARYQTYTEHPYYDSPTAIQSQQINDVVGMFSLGFLL